MRTIKELLQLMLDHQELFDDGLCEWAIQLYNKGLITQKEYLNLIYYIEDNPPTEQYSSFYYWLPEYLQPRLEWIKEHIELNP